MTPLLSVTGLCAFYGRAQTLFDLRFDLVAGEVVALLGRNGAGKSTTLGALMGLVEHRGRVLFGGSDLSSAQPYQACRAGLGFVPEDRRIFTDLTVQQNLELARRAPRTGAPAWTLARVFERFAALHELRARRGGQLSGGEQQMLALARTLMGNPRLVLLDEPSEGIAPRWVEQIVALVLELQREGVAVLLSEQNLALAAAVSARALILEKGQLRYDGPMRGVLDDGALREQYLGV